MVQMKLNNRASLIVSVYMDINNTAVIPGELDKAMDYANQKGLAIIIGADTNAHSTNYGPVGNTRGDGTFSPGRLSVAANLVAGKGIRCLNDNG